MIKLYSIIKLLTTTKSISSIFIMKTFGKRKKVTFWNGRQFKLNFSQYLTLIDSYSLMKEYDIFQLADDLFKIKKGPFELVNSLGIVCVVGELKRKYSVEQVENEIFKLRGDKLDLIGSTNMLHIVGKEIEQGVYNCDCQGKVVLDVGGFEGETAVFFSLMGAKKIVIYEPIVSHHEFIKKNIITNHVNAEIHEEGIGDSDGTQVISYDTTDVGFGVLSRGSKKIEIKIKAIESVIEECGASVAKIDCEGAEMSLLSVTREKLRLIDLYMVEVHTPFIRKALIKKFLESGFFIEKDVRGKKQSTIFFKRKIE